jgi:hypothetical protein
MSANEKSFNSPSVISVLKPKFSSSIVPSERFVGLNVKYCLRSCGISVVSEFLYEVIIAEASIIIAYNGKDLPKSLN